MKLVIIFLTINALAFGQTMQDNKVGKKIEGNFIGKDKKIIATSVKTKDGKGNPIEDGTPAEYEIRFSNSKLKPIKVGCCEIILINEGDLNQDGKEEISVYQAPMNGCTYTMTTYSFIHGDWKKIVDTFLVPTGCENSSNEDLQKMIFRVDHSIYYLEKDMSVENGKLIKKKIK